MRSSSNRFSRPRRSADHRPSATSRSVNTFHRADTSHHGVMTNCLVQHFPLAPFPSVASSHNYLGKRTWMMSESESNEEPSTSRPRISTASSGKGGAGSLRLPSLSSLFASDPDVLSTPLPARERRFSPSRRETTAVPLSRETNFVSVFGRSVERRELPHNDHRHPSQSILPSGQSSYTVTSDHKYSPNVQRARHSREQLLHASTEPSHTNNAVYEAAKVSDGVDCV